MHAAYDNSIRNNCVDTYVQRERFYGYTDKKISLKGLFCALLGISPYPSSTDQAQNLHAISTVIWYKKPNDLYLMFKCQFSPNLFIIL